MAAIPTLEEEDARRPKRERQNLVGEQTRPINRIKAILAASAFAASACAMRPNAEPDVLAYMTFPKEHRDKLHSRTRSSVSTARSSIVEDGGQLRHLRPDLVGDGAPLGTGGSSGVSWAKAVAMKAETTHAAAALADVRQYVPREVVAALAFKQRGRRWPWQRAPPHTPGADR